MRIARAGTLAAAFAIIALAGLAGTVGATPPNGDGQHQVWVCKYVGQPGDFETLKPGKNPIIVDVAAADDFVGADFADGQTHSVVIDLATDANTGQGERYIGDATCPTSTPAPSATPSPTPSVSPSVEPSSPPSPSPTPNDEPTPTPSATPSNQPSTAPSPSITVSPSPAPSTSVPSKPQPRVTPPPTSTDASTAGSSGSPIVLIGTILAFILAVMLAVEYLAQRSNEAAARRHAARPLITLYDDDEDI